MTAFIDRLLALKGKDPTDFKKNSKLGRLFRTRGVRKSSTIQRVLDIPRRVIDPASEEAVELLSEVFGYGTQKLRPLQAVALCDLHDYGGLFGPLAVGSGKTLCTLLAPVAVNAWRPVLILPAKLREKTFLEHPKIAAHWKIPFLRRADRIPKHPGDGTIVVMSYEWLGRPDGAEALEQFQPDLLILDECHRVKNAKAAVTKRVKRYVVKNRPRTMFLSGTVMSRSILDFAHLLEWALPDMNPTPETYPERIEWAQALDAKMDASLRLAPGALEALWNDEERQMSDATEATRRAFRRRLVETPGVVATSENDIGVSLRIETVDPWAGDKSVDAIFKPLRDKWELPDGQAIPDPPSFRRHAIELSLGFWYRWKVEPPIAWRMARSEWCVFVRETLKNNKRNIDSEGQVAIACQRGEYERDAWDRWSAIRGTFKPETEAIWVSKKILEFCVEWAKENEKPIIWVNQVQFGQELAASAGWAYYGAEAKDKKTKKHVMEHEEGAPMICSVNSVNEGQNLQAWCSNLITDITPMGRAWEQVLGRTHRFGQEADEVSVAFLVGCREAQAGFLQAREDARVIESMTGSRQKLVYADVIEAANGSGPRWA